MTLPWSNTIIYIFFKENILAENSEIKDMKSRFLLEVWHNSTINVILQRILSVTGRTSTSLKRPTSLHQLQKNRSKGHHHLNLESKRWQKACWIYCSKLQVGHRSSLLLCAIFVHKAFSNFLVLSGSPCIRTLTHGNKQCLLLNLRIEIQDIHVWNMYTARASNLDCGSPVLFIKRPKQRERWNIVEALCTQNKDC